MDTAADNGAQSDFLRRLDEGAGMPEKIDDRRRATAQHFVTAQPGKGERLVVIHTLPDEDFDLLLTKLDETGLPNLWIPKSKAFYKVDEIPILGTGKMDIKAVKTLARQLDIGD